MKKTLLSTSLSIILSVFSVCPIEAQQQAPPISQLKEQIQKLLLIDGDTNTPAHVKEFNRGMLEQRRNQLRTLLQTQLSDLRKYQSSARSALGADRAQRLGFWPEHQRRADVRRRFELGNRPRPRQVLHRFCHQHQSATILGAVETYGAIAKAVVVNYPDGWA